ncbi:MAG TPA: serine/threonine-protein kinase [Planctomycetota bacterium]|nr:serine/threonine-protein kinase [Planctomycetota bacterium]
MPCLFLVHSGPYRGKVFPVEATRPLLIGRALEADFTIPDGMIEAFHARVQFESGRTGRMAKVVALDAKEDYQLEVDGVPFDEALLKSGDRVKIGDTLLEFREGGSPEDSVGGRKADPGEECVACRRLVDPNGGGRILLGEVYCCRCVDLRLTVKRELGRYRVLRKIGRDVAEIVYLAEDLRSEPIERVSLHVLKSERQHDQRVLRRFLTKAAFARDLDSPLFPLTRDLSRKAEVHSYTEELIEWPSLAERLETGKTYPTYLAAKVAATVAEGLRFARRKGIVVGKLRAPRSYISDHGAVRIRDYWLTPETEEAVAQKIGAPAFLPLPELASAGDQDLSMPTAGAQSDDTAISADMRRYLAPDPRELAMAKDESLDVRAVAVLFAQLAGGLMPGEATPSEMADRARKGYLLGKRPSAAPEPPPLLGKIIGRAFEKNSPGRYPSLVEIAKDLKAIVPLV